jgi:hypothetical protein
MNRHGFLKRIWLAPLFIAALAAAHAFVFYRVWSHVVWITASALVVLVLLTHLGVVGSIYAIFTRPPRRKL